MNPSKIAQFAATGDVVTGSSALRAVVLSAGADAATVVVRAGGAGGTQVLTLKAPANTSVSTGYLADAWCANGIHVTLTGTGPACTVVWA